MAPWLSRQKHLTAGALDRPLLLSPLLRSFLGRIACQVKISTARDRRHGMLSGERRQLLFAPPATGRPAATRSFFARTVVCCFSYLTDLIALLVNELHCLRPTVCNCPGTQADTVLVFVS